MNFDKNYTIVVSIYEITHAMMWIVAMLFIAV